MAAPSITKMVKKVGLNVPPPPPKPSVGTSKADAARKRKSTAPAPEDQRQSKTQKAIPISTDDALVARLEQLKLSDSLIGHSLQALDAIGSVMTEADKRFCRSMDTPLLAEFCLHRSIQVRFELV